MGLVQFCEAVRLGCKVGLRLTGGCQQPSSRTPEIAVVAYIQKG